MKTKKYVRKIHNSSILKCFLLIISSMTHAQLNEPISPIPDKISTDINKVVLGKKLFFDKRLSKDNSVSCASCHELKLSFGTDLKPLSTGINGQKGERNSPTVYNAALNFTQFWDGRAKNLKEQASIPITNPVEMGMDSINDVITKLKDDLQYKKSFQAAYGTTINQDNLVDAIAEFQKTLLTVNSPFDRFLNGEVDAITNEQLNGYKLFKAYGCVSCHQGRNVGGNMYQKFGVLKDINRQSGSLSKDLGRYNITKNEWDKRVFKVPSLRLAAVTPPYFHNGSISTLKEAVEIMIEFQLGRSVPNQDVESIIEFLKSLVGEIPKGVTES